MNGWSSWRGAVLWDLGLLAPTAFSELFDKDKTFSSTEKSAVDESLWEQVIGLCTEHPYAFLLLFAASIYAGVCFGCAFWKDSKGETQKRVRTENEVDLRQHIADADSEGRIDVEEIANRILLDAPSNEMDAPPPYPGEGVTGPPSYSEVVAQPVAQEDVPNVITVQPASATRERRPRVSQTLPPVYEPERTTRRRRSARVANRNRSLDG